jgi:hypothetical protein
MLIEPPAMPTPTIAHIPDEIPDQYTVTFDKGADLGAHLTQLQKFIDASKNCTTLNNTVFTKFDESFMKFYAGTFDGRVLGFIFTAQGVQHIERSEMVEERALIPWDQNAKNGSDSQNAFAHARLDRRRDEVPWSVIFHNMFRLLLMGVQESRPNNTQGWSIDPGTKERPYRGTKSSFSFIAGLDISHQGQCQRG